MVIKSSLIIFLLFNFITIFESHSANLIVYKEPIRIYAIKNYNYTVQYKIYNTGKQPAFQIFFNDETSFPSNLFNLTKGHLKIELADIPPNEALIYSITVIPFIHGHFNSNIASVTYKSNKETNETLTAYSLSDIDKYYIYISLEECITRRETTGFLYMCITFLSLFIPYFLYNTYREKQKLSKEKCYCKRLIFDIQKLIDDEKMLESFFRKAIQSVTKEDGKKAMNFYYKNDSITFLMNRLIFRQMSKQSKKDFWFESEFNLFTKNEPFLSLVQCHPFSFDVTHQDNYTVLASSCTKQIGVSIIQLDDNKSYENEISLNTKNLLENISKMHNRSLQLYICRFVCLIRAFNNACKSKNVHIFRFQNDQYSPGCFITSTTIELNGSLLYQWLFEESFIGNNYIVAVCRLKNFYNQNCKFYRNSKLPNLFSNSILNDDNEIQKNSVKLHHLQDDAFNEYNIFKNKLCKF